MKIVIKTLAALTLLGIAAYVMYAWINMFGLWTTLGALGFFAFLGLLIYLVAYWGVDDKPKH